MSQTGPERFEVRLSTKLSKESAHIRNHFFSLLPKGVGAEPSPTSGAAVISWLCQKQQTCTIHDNIRSVNSGAIVMLVYQEGCLPIGRQLRCGLLN
jgi:hypothetical protein